MLTKDELPDTPTVIVEPVFTNRLAWPVIDTSVKYRNSALDEAVEEIERSYKTRTAAGFTNKTYRDTVLQHIAILKGLKHVATPLNSQPEQADG